MADRSLIRSFPTDGFGFVSVQDKFEEERVPGYNAENFYPIRLGGVYNACYQVLAKLGFGTTSTVWLCRDLQENTYLVLKVCTAEEAGPACTVGNELSVSRFLKAVEGEHPGKGFLRLAMDEFELPGSKGNHQCLLFTPLGLDFAKFRSRFPERALPKQVVQLSLQVLLVGLDFLHQAGVVHTDLSPNNILLGLVDSSVLSAIENEELQQPSHRKILPDRTIHMSHTMPITGGVPSICDFGSARIGTRQTGDVMPGQYRAPEVIMDMEWDAKIDMWALGLTVFLDRSENCRKYWDNDGKWIAATPIPNQLLETLERRFNGKDQELFIQLIRKILRWLPEERPSAEDLYTDDFIYQCRPGDVTGAS